MSLGPARQDRLQKGSSVSETQGSLLIASGLGFRVLWVDRGTEHRTVTTQVFRVFAGSEKRACIPTVRYVVSRFPKWGDSN